MTVNLLDANQTFLGMRDGDFEIVQAFPEAVLRRLVRVRGVDFDEAFVAELIGNHFIRKEMHAEPKISDAVAIYLHECNAGDGRKFRGDVLHVFRRFSSLFGDMRLCDLRYAHACIFRDHLLSLGLKPVTVRKQTAIFNAMLNAQHIGFHHAHLLDVGQQGLSGGGGPHLLATHQQALAQAFFECLDAQGHRRQRDGQSLRRRAKAPVFDHGGQGFELTGVEHVWFKKY
jgi:hypothetical protein